MKRVFILILVLIVGSLLLRSAGFFDSAEESPAPSSPSEEIAQEQEDAPELSLEEVETSPAEEPEVSDPQEESPIQEPENEESPSETQTENNDASLNEEEIEEETPLQEPLVEENNDEDLAPEEDLEEEKETPLSQKDPSNEEDLPPTPPQVVTPPAPTKPIVYENNEPFAFVDTVKVYLYEWEIDFLNPTPSSGIVRFEVQNTGNRSHNFTIRDVYDFGRIRPGETKILGIELPSGEFEIQSSLQVDLDRGMTGKISVTD